MMFPHLDLAGLAAFDPSLLICPNCRAMHNPRNAISDQHPVWDCPLCGRTLGTPGPQTIRALRESGHLHHDELRHSPERWSTFLRRLDMIGSVAGELAQGRLIELKTLLGLFELAETCIHIVTHGLISTPILNHLHTLATRVQVFAVISHMSRKAINTHGSALRHSYPQINAALLGTERGSRRMPHQKLIVIDGLMALSGSLNLTVAAWERAGLGLEIIHIHSAPSEAITLNNRFFAPIWRARNRYRGNWMW